MSQGLVRYILFLLAYIPIYIISGIKMIDTSFNKEENFLNQIDVLAQNNIIPISLFLLTIILILYFKIYAKLALKPKGNPIFTIKTIKIQHKEYVTYLGTYILPFVAIESKTTLDMIAVTFMFLTIGFIFSKTNLIYTNPTLTFFGYDIFEIETTDGNVFDCISKEDFRENEKPRGLKLGHKTFIISKWKNKN